MNEKIGAKAKEPYYGPIMAIQPKVVLVAEDDDFIREIVSDFLSEMGHAVLQVADAAQALEMLRESSHTIDMLFTDVRMPGRMDGMQLAGMVTTTWPAIKVLIASGHVRPSQAEIPARSMFLPKPYTCEVVEEAIKVLFSDLSAVCADQTAGRRAII